MKVIIRFIAMFFSLLALSLGQGCPNLQPNTNQTEDGEKSARPYPDLENMPPIPLNTKDRPKDCVSLMSPARSLAEQLLIYRTYPFGKESKRLRCESSAEHSTVNFYLGLKKPNENKDSVLVLITPELLNQNPDYMVKKIFANSDPYPGLLNLSLDQFKNAKTEEKAKLLGRTRAFTFLGPFQEITIYSPKTADVFRDAPKQIEYYKNTWAKKLKSYDEGINKTFTDIDQIESAIVAKDLFEIKKVGKTFSYPASIEALVTELENLFSHERENDVSIYSLITELEDERFLDLSKEPHEHFKLLLASSIIDGIKKRIEKVKIECEMRENRSFIAGIKASIPAEKKRYDLLQSFYRICRKNPSKILSFLRQGQEEIALMLKPFKIDKPKSTTIYDERARLFYEYLQSEIIDKDSFIPSPPLNRDENESKESRDEDSNENVIPQAPPLPPVNPIIKETRKAPTKSPPKNDDSVDLLRKRLLQRREAIDGDQDDTETPDDIEFP